MSVKRGKKQDEQHTGAVKSVTQIKTATKAGRMVGGTVAPSRLPCALVYEA